jgi:hypothetical protein
MSANKSKYMVVTQVFLKKDYPEKNVLLSETTLFFSRKKDANCQAQPIFQKEIP